MRHDAPPGYRDLEICGVGATSRVFRAIEARTGRTVALKRLHRQMVRSPEALARLKRELEALSRLNHPVIAPSYDVIRWGGDPTLVLAFVPGVDLKARIDREGPLAFAEVERIARALFDVLSAAHAAGIVHRDVKPQNVRIRDDGSIFLLDFGSARLDAASELTRTGTTVGTPQYMAPELFAGSVYDPRVDVYGVGATLFECLTGRPPQSADSLAELAHLRSKRAIDPVASIRAGVPAHLAQVTDRCLALAPEDRYASAALAIWALDHPALERAFQARRSRNPPCLHCGEPITPLSSLCPSCKHESPFAYEAGDAHVEIDWVREPARFIEHVAAELPEQAQPARLFALAEHTARLSFGRERYLSFIDREQAERVVKRLEAIGVHARVVEERRPTWRALLLALALVMTGAVAGLFPWAILGVGAAYLVDRLASLRRARHGMLSNGWLPKPAWPTLGPRALALAAAAAGAVLLAEGGAFDEATFAQASTLAIASPLFVALASAIMGVAGARARSTAEPRFLAQARRAFALGSPSPRALAAPGLRMAPLTRAVALAIFAALVPAEMKLLSDLGIQVAVEGHREAAYVVTYDGFGPFLFHSGRAPRIAPAAAAETSSELVPIVGGLLDAPWPSASPGDEGGEARASAPPGPSSASAVPPARTPTRLERVQRGVAVSVGLLPLLLALAAVAALFRRVRRIEGDARAIVAELDIGLLDRLAAKRLPLRRSEAHVPDAAERLAELEGRNAFTRDAVCRAADLAECVSPADADRMRRAIATVAEVEASEAVREESLLARCILETDQSYRARFEILALEGELEAEAAVRWAERLASLGAEDRDVGPERR